MRCSVGVGVALAMFVGCGEPVDTSVSLPASEQTLVALRQADAVDGAEDHVIGKCYVCNLGMDGKEEFSVDVYGYSAHLCSSHCKEHFAKSADSVIVKTKIPGAQ